MQARAKAGFVTDWREGSHGESDEATQRVRRDRVGGRMRLHSRMVVAVHTEMNGAAQKTHQGVGIQMYIILEQENHGPGRARAGSTPPTQTVRAQTETPSSGRTAKGAFRQREVKWPAHRSAHRHELVHVRALRLRRALSRLLPQQHGQHLDGRAQAERVRARPALEARQADARLHWASARRSVHQALVCAQRRGKGGGKQESERDAPRTATTGQSAAGSSRADRGPPGALRVGLGQPADSEPGQGPEEREAAGRRRRQRQAPRDAPLRRRVVPAQLALKHPHVLHTGARVSGPSDANARSPPGRNLLQSCQAAGSCLHRELLAGLARHQLALGVVRLKQVERPDARGELDKAVGLVLHADRGGPHRPRAADASGHTGCTPCTHKAQCRPRHDTSCS